LVIASMPTTTAKMQKAGQRGHRVVQDPGAGARARLLTALDAEHDEPEDDRDPRPHR
jgi:hypothetical protein